MSRVCTICARTVSKGSKTGICWPCYTRQNHGLVATVTQADIDAEQGSRALLAALRLYGQRYQPDAAWLRG